MSMVKKSLGNRRVKVSQRFVIALAVVSILGFSAIVSQTLFNKDINLYVESFWMVILGIGLIVEANFRKLRSIARGITPNNFTHLTTTIMGLFAILAGILSFPSINVQNPSFLAIKGIISIIAIIFIIIQTVVVES